MQPGDGDQVSKVWKGVKTELHGCILLQVFSRLRAHTKCLQISPARDSLIFFEESGAGRFLNVFVDLFLWRLAHKALLTNEFRRSRHISHSDVCPICGTHPESILHALRDCDRINRAWRSILPIEVWLSFFGVRGSRVLAG